MFKKLTAGAALLGTSVLALAAPIDPVADLPAFAAAVDFGDYQGYMLGVVFALVTIGIVIRVARGVGGMATKRSGISV
jgi:hypothetical protein